MSHTTKDNNELEAANWRFGQTMTGTGSVMQVVAPATNTSMRFFRVRQP